LIECSQEEMQKISTRLNMYHIIICKAQIRFILLYYTVQILVKYDYMNRLLALSAVYICYNCV